MNAVSQLDREWSTIATGEVADGFSRWRRRESSLRRFASPPQLLAFLRGATELESDAPLLALLLLAPSEPLAGRLLLQAILPALKAQSARIAHPRVGLEELWELLLFHAWQAICCYPVAKRRRQVAANLVLQVLHDTTRELQRDDPPHAAARFSDSRTPPPAPAPLGPGEAELLVLAAAAAGAIAARDAELILESRLGGIRIGSAAKGLAASEGALYKRRQRAENRLAQFLGARGDVQETTLSDLISRAEERPRAHLQQGDALRLRPADAV